MRRLVIGAIIIFVCLVAIGVLLIVGFAPEFFKDDTAGSSVPDGSSSSVSSDVMTCEDRGCLSGSVFVGSVNSDKFYECDCYHADRVLPENIVCFDSVEEAVDSGYERVVC